MGGVDRYVPYLGSYRMESQGREYRFARCPFCDYAKRAFYINPQKGTFHCFHCERGGTLTELDNHLGLKDQSSQYTAPRSRWSRALFEKAHARLLASEEALSWLEARGIDRETIEREMLGLVSRGQRRRDGGLWDDDYILIPYWDSDPSDPEAQAFMVKYRGLHKKMYIREAGTDSGLFRAWACPGSEIIHVTEGEFDALVLARYGFAAVSVPNGAQAGLTANDARLLSAVKTVYIWGDNDAAGLQFARRAAELLEGRGRVVVLPEGVKDVTELWQRCRDQGDDFAEIVRTLCENAITPGAEGFVTLRQALEELIAQLAHPQSNGVAFYFPWQDVTESILSQPGDVIVLSAGTKVGKTTLAKQCALECARRGLTVVYVATETLPTELASTVVAEIARVPRGIISPADVEHAKAELGLSADRFVVGVPVAHRVDDWKRAITKVLHIYSPHVLILDYLQRMVGEDTKDQASFMTWMVNETIHRGIVTFMIVQPRKPMKMGQTPDFLDIRGSSQIYEGAAHVFVLYRRVRDISETGEAYENDGILYRRLSRRPRGHVDKFELYFHPEYICWIRAERLPEEERSWTY
jgi:hypothetical protein